VVGKSIKRGFEAVFLGKEFPAKKKGGLLQRWFQWKEDEPLWALERDAQKGFT